MNFFYEALDANGQTVLGKIDASDITEAHLELQKRGFRATSLAPSVAAQTVETYEPVLPQTAPAPAYQATSVLTAPQAMPQVIPQAQAAAHTATQRPRAVNITLTGSAAQTIGRLEPERAVATPAHSPTLQRARTGSKLGGVSTRDLMFFFKQLASLVRSGMTVYTALDNLAPRTANSSLSRVAKEMAQAAQRGDRISEVMDGYPRIFPDHIVGVVRAGETGGFLEIALAEIALDYEQNIALYRGAWIPKLMATQAFFMLPFVIPLFTSLFHSLDFAANARLYVQQVGFIYLPLFGGLYALSRLSAKWLQLPQYRYLRDGWALKLPPFGDLQRQASLASFVRMLRRLTHAGIAPIHAWEAAMHTAGNVVIRDRLSQSYQLMQNGASFSDAFQATGLFNNSVEQLIVTGQQSGQLVEMLDQAADFYQEQVDQSSRKAKFMMLRLGVLALLIFGGATMLWMAKTYFDGVFNIPKMMFPELEQ